jgi:DNA helicase-2/ATP-dependent DNA helicase PcrA
MHRVFEGYERRKATMGRVDFEDMLELAVRLLDEHPDAAAAIRDRFHAFTVDEFQDVSPLQAALLDAWLGDRDEVCVVGDDHQTIFSFTGASPGYLAGFAQRFPGAAVVTLRENYRSSPGILALANRLATSIRADVPRTLEATRPDGPPPGAQGFASEDAETAAVVAGVRQLHDEANVPFEEIAIVLRINARTEPFEEAFAETGVPYQVKDGAFLSRPGPRAVIAQLGRLAGDPALPAVEKVTDELGFDPVTVHAADDEATRQADLARLRALARGFVEATPDGDAPAFVEELRHRFTAERDGRGVQLLTFHRAKGLEFDAVFIPRLIDGELPYRSGRAKADPDEERRLLYVGVTRARHHLFLTWSREGKAKPSPYLAEMGLSRRPRRTA